MKFVPIIISLFSLLISFFVAFRNVWVTRKNIDITQTDNAVRSLFLKSYDGCITSYDNSLFRGKKDSTPNIRSVGLVEIVITNKSSLPISILEFSIPDFPAFSSYSPTIDSFTVTTQSTSKTIVGEKNSPLEYLKPEFTLNPYTSKRGYLLFWSGIEKDVSPMENITLTILTSRGTFKKKIKFSSSMESIKKRVHYSQDEIGNIIETFTN